jgi:2-methylcitrate dehydratase
MRYPQTPGATVFGSTAQCAPEKAILANASAVREWDSNGTVFGYNSANPKHQAGEFGHNDYYPVSIAAAELKGLSGKEALMGMCLSDEIRGRLAEVFSLKSYKIDHVVHGAIASAATYGALLDATPEQIEHAIGMVVAHYIPFRAIRAGKQLSDSKGASAAISTEAAIMSVHRAIDGFIGPKDIFRNPEAIFRLNEPTNGDSPFDLELGMSGSDFSVMGMHFKLGIYEHQSAGAIQGLIELVSQSPDVLNEQVDSLDITIYEPAFGIIGDPAKRTPTTRQSADHSMVFIITQLFEKMKAKKDELAYGDLDQMWKQLILTPDDYDESVIEKTVATGKMNLINFEHGGNEYDSKYPEGIPTKLVIRTPNKSYDSGLVMFPVGHANNKTCDLKGILANKWRIFGGYALEDPDSFIDRLNTFEDRPSVTGLYDCKLLGNVQG